ncbi:MAG: hypothetical protein E4G91_05560 [Candidatus Zixiibacteriota bacterium]|nr:MAG: hypothetical protein E4G91_05560 [candidate division Zixibacteria bacterium]
MWKSLMVGAIVATLLLQQCGCSLIGLGIGASIDSGNKKQIPAEGWQIADVPEGTNVTVVLNNGSSVIGKLCGVDFAGAASFQDDYVRARQEDSAAALLPDLGDSLVLRGRWGAQIEGKLVGVDRSREKNKWEYWLKISQEDREKPRLCRLSDVHDIRKGDGSSLTGSDFCRILDETVKTSISTVSVCGDPGGSRSIPASDINHVTFTKKGKAAQTGFLIGLAVDATIIAVAVIANSHDDPPPYHPSDTGITSCPFVYSLVDSSYIFDAEPLGAAICRSLQRTDLTVLNHAQENGGFYRFRITNELAETEFLDEVKLLAVDHPDSVQVVPSFDGALHTVCSPQTPLSAVDYHGANLLDLVKYRDTEFWVSNPFYRISGVDAQIRDGLELEFAKPPDAQSVKLALNVQNTLWGAEMLNKAIALLGPEADVWYAGIARSTNLQQSLEQAMIREGMLVVKVWNGSSWKDVDFVWGVGPRMPKAQLVKLDVGGITGNRLRVRLESTAGFWMINSVLADYSADLPLEVTELAAVEATDQLGRDRRPLLARSDNKYHVMPTNSDRIEIAFAAPPPRNELNRSLVWKCTGYYNIHVPYGSEPNPELMARLISEPGAFGRFALEMLSSGMNAALAGRSITSLYHRW